MIAGGEKAENEALEKRRDSDGNGVQIELKLTARVQNWGWNNKQKSWKKQGNPEDKSKIKLRGTWKDNGDFVKMTWETGYGK